MNVIIIESEAFLRMQAEQARQTKQAFKEALQEFLKENKSDAEWLTLKEAMELLPYKSKTKWQQLRDEKKIEFTKNGRLILYNKKSLEQLILKNIK